VKVGSRESEEEDRELMMQPKNTFYSLKPFYHDYKNKLIWTSDKLEQLQ